MTQAAGERGRWPIELVTFLYVLMWIPYTAMTRMLATVAQAHGEKPLTGLQILPGQISITAVAIFGVLYFNGWWRSAHRTPGFNIPVPTPWTALSGLSTSVILVTVPLSLTFPDVSIPFALLLMRGDLLLAAPVVDLFSGRRVRWYSWIALLLVLAGLGASVWNRGGLHLPLLCGLTIAAYVVAYFARLAIMTHCAKRDDPNIMKAYFVEETIVAYPAALLLLFVFSWLPLQSQSAQLRWGFTGIWTNPGLPVLAMTGMLIAIIGVIAAIILLDPRENTYCVPLERSASVLGGLAATYVLAGFFHLALPATADVFGALLLVAAIALLSLGPRIGRKQKIVR